MSAKAEIQIRGSLPRQTGKGTSTIVEMVRSPRRIWGFGFRTGFGFRISDFGFSTRPASAAAAILLLAWPAGAATIQEDFATDPAARSWQTYGLADLFQWDPVLQNLAVTWDSSKPNSYFYRPLGTILAKSDDLQVSFDLQILSVEVGINAGKPVTFELAAGLIRLRDATSTNFLRGTARQSPNLLEFDYFPDSGFGATISPVIVSSNNQFIPSFSFPLELTLNSSFHVALSYSAATETLTTTLLRDGQPFGPIKDVKLPGSFTDYRVDTLAICSYNDQGADGSVLAHGRIDNIRVTVPDPPQVQIAGSFKDKAWQVEFASRTNWTSTLERTTAWKEWIPVSANVPGTGGPLALQDEQASPRPEAAFYRVRLERP